jgi:2-iminobutanoate/2-iminopropanoate deaminase
MRLLASRETPRAGTAATYLLGKQAKSSRRAPAKNMRARGTTRDREREDVADLESAKTVPDRPTLPISQVRESGEWVFLAGQGGLNERHEVVGSTIEEQTRQALSNVDALLQTVGCRLSDVVSALVHLSDLSNFDGYNSVYAQFFPDPKPVRTTVEARLLLGILIEITVVARRDPVDRISTET